MEVTEFSTVDGRYIAYGNDPDVVPVYERGKADKFHTGTVMYWPTVDKFMRIMDAVDVGDLTQDEINERYGKLRGRRPKELPPY